MDMTIRNFNNNGIIFSNFEGYKDEYHPFGKWSFAITVDSKEAKEFKKKHYNIKSVDINPSEHTQEWLHSRKATKKSKKYYYFNVTVVNKTVMAKRFVNGRETTVMHDSNILLRTTDNKLYLLTSDNMKILDYIQWYTNDLRIHEFPFNVGGKKEMTLAYLYHLSAKAYINSEELHKVADLINVELW